jgi:lipoprotein-anchoring transpeptidase ErfK/SrfK
MKLLLPLIIGIYALWLPASAGAKEIITTDKLITVDIGKQLLTAWDGGQVKYQTKVSTGLPLSATPRGSFTILSKNPLHDMIGVSPYKGRYHLKDVPHSMYFYRGGYAIHGTYWHNSFGRRASNGCVNVPVSVADDLYAWAPVGTRVEIW